MTMLIYHATMKVYIDYKQVLTLLLKSIPFMYVSTIREGAGRTRV